MRIQKLTFLSLILFSFLLLSCNKNTQEIVPEKTLNNEDVTSVVQDTNNNDILSWNIEALVQALPNIPQQDVENLNESVKNSDFITIQKILPWMIETLKKEENPNTEMVKVLTYNYVSAMLNEWNYFYKEQDKATQAIEYLNDLLLTDTNFVDPVYNNYYLGYANEIIKKYDEALKYYNEALKLAPNIEKNKKIRAMLLNQIGHVYDLMWDMAKANTYYLQSEELGISFIWNLINRGRYEFRMKNYDGAEKYFTNILGLSKDSFVKAEMYFNLWSIYLTKKDGVEKALEFAQKWIEANKSYPYNYLNQWIGYIYLWWEENIKKAITPLKKVINLYPNSSSAYKYLWIISYIQDDFATAIDYFKKQVDATSKDMILMKDEQEIMYKDGIYDLSRTYAMMWNVTESMKKLDILLSDGKNKNYYIVFMRDFAKDNWPYTKVISTEDFKTHLNKYINLYK